MTLQPTLFNAILSMDAYNRGYDASIDLGTRDTGGNFLSIGNTEIFDEKGDSPAEAIGFYAIAYDIDSDGVADTIAYRGTDYPEVDMFRDLEHGWLQGGGSITQEQTTMAVEFYQEVVGRGNQLSANVTLTGHSLGGGLAGFVGSLYGRDADVFDTMTFALAADNAYEFATLRNVSWVDFSGTQHDEVLNEAEYQNVISNPNNTILGATFTNPEYRNDLYGDDIGYVDAGAVQAPNPDGIRGYHVKGEVLDELLLLRGDEAESEAPLYLGEDGDIFELVETSLAYQAIYTGVASFVAGPGGAAFSAIVSADDFAEAVALHSQASLVIRKFADEPGQASKTDWQTAAQHFWPVLYDDAFAASVGYEDDDPGSLIAGELQRQDKFADILRMAIAYSAIDEGERPFGDMGIRSLYDDANNLGEAITLAGAGSSVETYANEISQVFVELAGKQALLDVERDDLAHFSSDFGVLWGNDWQAYGPGIDWAGGDRSLTVSLSENYWALRTGQAAGDITIASRDALVGKIIADTGQATQIHADMTALWGSSSYSVIDEVVFSTDDAKTVTMGSAYSTGKRVFVGDGDDETVTGAIDSLIFTHGGEDHVEARNSSVIYLGGDNDTYSTNENLSQTQAGNIVYGGGGYDVADYSNFGSIKVVPDGDGYRVYMVGDQPGRPYDTLYGFEEIVGTYGNDYFKFGSQAVAFNGYLGNDQYEISANIADVGDTIRSPNRIIDDYGINRIVGADAYEPTTIGSIEAAENDPAILTNTIGRVNAGGGVTIRGNDALWPVIELYHYNSIRNIEGDIAGPYYGNGGSVTSYLEPDEPMPTWGSNVEYTVASTGAETFTGTGSVSDIVSYSASSNAVSIDLLAGTGSGGDAQGDSYVSVEHLIGSNDPNAGDTLYGNDDANEIYGLLGDDLLVGNAGNDTLKGGDGDDILRPGDGDDLVEGGNGYDVVEFSGDYVEYTLMQEASYWRVVDAIGNEGTNLVYNAELLKFADGEFDTQTQIFTPILVGGPEAPKTNLALLEEGGVSFGPRPDDANINLSSTTHKIHAISFETGADVTTRQIIYEQGGATRGLNMFIEGGKLYGAVWNKAEENWGYVELSEDISADTKYTASLVMKGAMPSNGLATLYLNGEADTSFLGIGNLYAHGDDIAVGQIAGSTLVHNSKVSSGSAFTGSIEKMVHYDGALSASEFDQLQDYLADGWLVEAPPPPAEIVMMEFGSVDTTHAQATVSLTHTFNDPVVFVTMTTFNGAQLAVPRVTDITNDSFTFYAQEADYLDGNHASESFSYIVVEKGSWVLSDGTKIEAGAVDTNLLSKNGFESVSFATAFDAKPATFTQVQTDNDADFVATRQRNADVDGFEIALSEEELSNSGTHGVESLGWLAIEQGLGSDDGHDFLAAVGADSFTHNWQDIVFDDHIDQLPQLLASISTHDGGDASFIRADSLSQDGVSVQIQEDQSKDTEVTHTTERIDVFAIEGSGTLTGILGDAII